MTTINEINAATHRIEARLYPNYLEKGPGKFVARAKSEAPLSIEGVCAAAKMRGGFSGRIEDIIEHSRLFIDEVIYQLLDGFSVQFGSFFSLHAGVSGTYNSSTDRISPEMLHITFRTLSQLKELLLKVAIENEGVAPDTAFIDEVIDVTTDSLNGVLTPGGQIHLLGHKIKVEGEEEAVGLWFVSQPAGNPRTKVAMNFSINKTSEIVATIPPLTAGIYSVEIVTRYSSGSVLLKEPRVITARPLLTVL
ncbi:hypothetical protein FACS1894140_3690 [Spirochaetia bacterium]|nr:hypothetical protein FACS1894140_3690 [Spirochaetia bacterium]